MRREGARDSERSSSTQAANSGSEKSSARIATIGPKQAGRSSSRAIASPRSRAPECRASRASSASVPPTAAICAICTPRVPAVASRAKISSPSAGTFASRSLTADAYGTPSGMPPRSAIARPSSASHGPSAACTLSSAAKAVTASAASPPGRASARSGSPRRGRALMALNLVARYPLSPADVNEPATPTPSAAGPPRRARSRRATAVLAVTARRLRARPGRALLVSAGVTVAVAFLTGVAGGSAVSEDLALRHALAALPPAERALRVAWSGQTAPGGYAALDRSAQRAAGSLTAEPLTRSVELNDVRFGGRPRQARGGERDRPLRAPAGGPPAAGVHARALRGRPDRRHPAAARRRVRHPPRRRGARALASLVPFGAGGLSTQRTDTGLRAGAGPALLQRARPRVAAAAAPVLAQLRLDGGVRPGQRARLGRRPPARQRGPGRGAPDGGQRPVRHHGAGRRSRRRARRAARRRAASCSSAARRPCSCWRSPG